MSEYPIPEDLRVVGDLFPHRYRPARDDEGFALGNLLPCDSGPWISTVHAFSVAKTLIERIAKQDAEIERLTEVNTKMREILTSISAVFATIESCTFVNHRLTANEVLEPLQAKILVVLIAARAKEKP